MRSKDILKMFKSGQLFFKVKEKLSVAYIKNEIVKIDSSAPKD